MTMIARNPATGEEIRRYPTLDDAALEERLERAGALAPEFASLPVGRRASWLARAGALLEERKSELGRLMTAEMGKPIGAAEAEAAKCAWVCRYYAEHAEDFLADEAGPEEDGRRSLVRFQPLGVVLAVMPWNFPFWQVFRFAAPALAAGNVGLLKHASNVPGCALAIEEILLEAGFPGGAFQALLIGSDRVEGVLSDPRVRAATLTGSDPAGRAVAAAAGSHLKKTVLELGGSDPFVVLSDADVEAAARVGVRARTLNNGQSCIAAKRFVIVEAAWDTFLERFLEGMRALRVGDPADPATDVGPLATEAIRDELHDQVQASVRAGGRLLLGGRPLDGAGWFYPPTVLVDVPAGAPARTEELFGPVATLIRVAGPEEALAVANETDYGLGSSVWTRDAREIRRFTDGLEAGSVFVNDMVASDPRLPFGGIKRSGYGRELAREGMREFLNVKTVSLAP